MAKQFEMLTVFDAWQLKQSLEIKNDGKASITSLSKMIKISEKIGEIPKIAIELRALIDTYSDEEKKTLTDEQVRTRQHKEWDEIMHQTLILEDDEFEELKSCFDFCDSKELFPRNLDVAKRLVKLKSKFEVAKALDLNEKKEEKKSKKS